MTLPGATFRKILCIRTMTIPDFQTLMRPVLEELEDGADRPVAELRERLATRFALTDDEREQAS
jgi:restriction system protein